MMTARIFTFCTFPALVASALAGTACSDGTVTVGSVSEPQNAGTSDTSDTVASKPQDGGTSDTSSSKTCSFRGDVVWWDGNGHTIPAPRVAFAEGERFLGPDGCNTCTCSEGAISCTEMACNHQVCNPYKIGQTFPAPDGCNTCTCTDRGVSCTEAACPANQ